MFSRKVNIIFFVFLLLFGITLMFLQMFGPDWSNQPAILVLYAQFPVLVSILLALIGFQKNIHNEFIKSLFHGYVFLLIFLASVVAIIFHFSPWAFFYVYWSILIFLFPVSIVLFFIRKVKSKKYRFMGYAIALIVFVTVFYIYHNTMPSKIMALLGYAFPPLP